MRTTAVAIPALLLTLPTGARYAHWLTITLILTLQPFFALTWQRALERVAGTVLGGVAAAVFAAFVHSPLATAALLFPLAVVAFAVRRVSFGLFMAALTPLIVLLSELGQPGASEFAIAAWRAGYTIAGGAMAVLGGLLLWPSWEPARVRGDLLNAIRAHAAYADSELAALLGEPRRIGRTRRGAWRALPATISRPVVARAAGARAGDPPRAGAARCWPTRHCAGSRDGWRRCSTRRVWRARRTRAPGAMACRRLRRARAGRRAAAEPPADAPAASLARIARQIELIDGALHPADAEQPEAPGLRSPP